MKLDVGFVRALRQLCSLSSLLFEINETTFDFQDIEHSDPVKQNFRHHANAEH